MVHRRVISAGSEFEEAFGYARAVRTAVGQWVSVSGCTAAGPDGPVGGGDISAQSRECLCRIRSALAEAGASTTDVVRTRFFVTDISAWREVGKIHLEFFGEVRPTTTIVEVRALVFPELLVEVEADAVVAAAAEEESV